MSLRLVPSSLPFRSKLITKILIGSCLFSGAAFADDTQQSEPLSSKQIVSKNPDNLPSASAMFGPPGDGGGGGFGGGNSDTYVPPKTYTYNYAEINNVQMDVWDFA